MAHLEEVLRTCGLNTKETALYKAALELGSASVQRIAEKAALARSTAYEVLETLRAKGMVTTFLKKKARYFSAEEPRRVLARMEQRVSLLKESLPELEAMHSRSRKRPGVRMYEGKAGIATVLEEILEEASELLSFGAADDIFREVEKFENFVEERVRRKIPVRVILPNSAKAQERKRLGQQQLRQVRIVPSRPEFHGMMYVWKSKVCLISFTGDYVVVVIESAAIAEMQRALFEHAWGSQEPA